MDGFDGFTLVWFFSCRCEWIWIRSLHFRTRVWRLNTWVWIFSQLWMTLVWKSTSSYLGSNSFTHGVWIFSQLWSSIDWKSVFSWLGLTVSHLGCEFVYSCEQIWIENIKHAYSYLGKTVSHPGCEFFLQLWSAMDCSLHFRGWVWRFCTWCVNFFTSVNGSELKFFVFL